MYGILDFSAEQSVLQPPRRRSQFLLLSIVAQYTLGCVHSVRWRTLEQRKRSANESLNQRTGCEVALPARLLKNAV